MPAPFDKKVPAYQKKRTDNPRKESVTKDLFEEPISEDHKEDPTNCLDVIVTDLAGD